MSKGKRPSDDEEIKKADPEDKDGDDEEEEEGEEDEEEKMKKAIISESELLKGLRELDDIAKRPTSRKRELLQKAHEGDLSSLSGTERKELRQLLEDEEGGGFRKSLAEDDTLEKAMNVAPVIDAFADKISEALAANTAELHKSIDGQGHFNEALAKSLLSLGEVVKGQNGEIRALKKEIVALQAGPARDPKATTAGELKKGLVSDGTKQGEWRLSKSQTARMIEEMFHDSLQKGLQGKSVSGLLIQNELAKFLHPDGALTPAFATELVAFAKAKQNGTA